MTLAPAARDFPAAGLCLTTLPVFAVAPLRIFTLPSRQPFRRSTFRTAGSFFPLSFGTRHFAGWVAGAGSWEPPEGTGGNSAGARAPSPQAPAQPKASKSEKP